MSKTVIADANHTGIAHGMSRRAFLLGLAGSAAVLAGCTLDPANPANRSGKVRIGSAMFPESEIIARIWAGALSDAGMDVEVVPQIGARDVYLAALDEGSIDLVPEYTGNAAAYWGDVPAGAEPDEVYNALVRNLPRGFEALDKAPAESKDAYRIVSATAEERGIYSLADLSKLGHIRIGGSPELAQRPYGPKGLKEFYGVTNVEMIAYGDSGGPLTIRALADGAVDIADIYTTTPIPEGVDFVTLEDPKQLISAQNVVPIARAGVFDQSAREILRTVNERLTTKDLTAMNLRASGEEKAGAELIASEWLEGH